MSNARPWDPYDADLNELKELVQAELAGNARPVDWGDVISPEELSSLIAVAEAALDLCQPPNACACSGPGKDSLPGECRCQTAGRKNWERLEAALAPFKETP